MAKRDIFAELVEGFDNLKEEREGKITLRTHDVESRPALVMSAADVRRVRKHLGMSQAVFARVLRARVRTYERWEKTGVTGPQAALLKLVDKDPNLLEELKAM